MFKMLVFSFIVSLVIGLALGPFVIKELKKFHGPGPHGMGNHHGPGPDMMGGPMMDD